MKPVIRSESSQLKRSISIAMLTAFALSGTSTAYGAVESVPAGTGFAKNASVPSTTVTTNITAPVGTAAAPTAAPAEVHGANPVRQIPSFEIPQTAETIDKVGKLEAEGEKYFAQHLYDKALATWQECYGMSLEMKYAEGEGHALTNMTRVYVARNQAVKAKYLGENAIEVLAGSSDPIALGKARLALAQAYLALDNGQWAATQLDEALKVFTAPNCGSPGDAAGALTMAANILLQLNKTTDSLKFFDAAANYYVQAGDIANAVGTRVHLASMMGELGLYTASCEEANKALELGRGSGKSANIIGGLAALGSAQFTLGEYANSRKTFEEALRLAPKCTIGELGELQRAFIDLGYGCALAATGEPELARQVLERVLPALKTGGSICGQAEALNALGNLYEAQGDRPKAIAYFQQALDLQNMIVPRQPRMNLIVLQNLAASLSRSGDNRDSKQRLLIATHLFKKAKSSPLQGRTLSSLAEVNMKLADAPAAEDALHAAIEISEKVTDDAALWRDYTLQAKLQMQAGQNDAAKESLNSALSHFRSPQAGSFPSPERLDFISTRADLGEQLIAMLAKYGMGEKALLAAEQLKEENLSNEYSRHGGQVKPEDRDVYIELSNQRAHLHAAEAANDPKKMLSEWQNWLVRFKQLVGQNRPLARMVAPVPNSVADIMRTVKSGKSTMVEYVVGSDSSVVFTVEPTGRIAATVLPVTRRQLQSQVSALLTASAMPPQQEAQRTRGLLQALGTELLPSSVRAFLPKNPEQLVAIIPDGILRNLPFAALLDTQGKYLIEEHTITLASSIGALLDSPPKYADSTGVLVAASTAGRDEASMLSSALAPEQVTKLVGSEADINAFVEQARGKSALHVASNVPISRNPMSAVVPMVAKEDGGRKVTANRLFSANMPNDLVVLSSTSINAKDTDGTAVGVFSRGLNYAGARNVMMSLWVEPDRERTSQLVEFYKNQQAGLSQAHSLRRAQLLALSRDPSPHSWAAFQLLGPGY